MLSEKTIEIILPNNLLLYTYTGIRIFPKLVPMINNACDTYIYFIDKDIMKKKNHSLVTKITILIIYAHTIIKKNVCIACFKRSVNAYHLIDGRNRVTEYVRESLYTRKGLFKNKNYHTGKRQNFFVGKHSKLWSLQTAKEWNQIGTRYINSANLWPYSLFC